MTDLAQLSFSVDSRPVETGAVALDRFGQSATRAGAKVSAAETASSAALARIGTAAQSMGAAAESAARRMAAIDTAPVVQAGRNFSSLGPAVQNASFQLQDMTVQLQMGTAASIVLAQQLPQLMGGFGALGASLGLVVGLSVPLIARLGDMAEVSSAAEESLGRLASVMPSIASAGNLITSAMTTVAENLDRIAFYAGAAAAVFAGRYVAGLAAAAVATGSLSGALVVLRGAIMRTGFGVLIVGAGEMAYRFSQLVQGAGGFGEALDLLKEVGREAFERIVSAGQAAASGLTSVAYSIKAAFLDAFSGIVSLANDWAEKIRSVLNPALEALGATAIEGQRITGEALRGAAEDALAAAKNHAAAAQGYWGQARAGMKSVDALRDAIAKGAATMESAGKSADLWGGSLDDAGGSAGKAGKAAKGAGDAADLAGEQMADAADEAYQGWSRMEQAVDGVATAFGDFVSRGLKDFKGFVSDILGSFQRMISEMVATAARNRIMLSIGSMGGAPLSAIPGLGGGGAGGVLSGIVGSLGGGGFLGGLGSVLGGIKAGGLAGGFGAIGTALSGATSGLAGLATAAGALALPIAGVAAAFSFFRSKTKELDRGLRVTADGAGALVEQFRKVEKSRFWGLSKSRDTDFDPAGAETAGPIRDAYRDIRTAVSGMANAIGAGSKALRNFSHEFTVSLKDMTEEQAQQEIARQFGLLSDAMARAAMGTGRYIRDNETATQALERMSAALNVANGAFRTLGVRLYDVSLAGGEFASRFVDRLGGLDAFAQTSQFFFENFYTLSQRAKEAQRQFVEGFKAIPSGIARAIPETETQFRQLFKRLMNAGHRESGADLLKLAPLFIEMQRLQDELDGTKTAAKGASDSLADNTARMNERRSLLMELWRLEGNTWAIRKAELRQLDPTNRALQKLIWAREDEQAAAEKAARKAEERAARAERRAEERAARAARAADERGGLRRRLLELQGRTAALRRLDLKALDASNRALLRQIHALEDQAAAAEKAAEKEAERQEKLAAVADERKSLEERLLDLQGNTAELRRRELAALDPSNRALQRMIWGLEDAKEALDALNPQDFATMLDFRRAQAFAARGVPSNVNAPLYQPGKTGPVATDQGTVVELRKVREEIARMREEQRQLGMNISTNTKGTRDVLRKFDADGMPPVRA